MNQYFDSKIFFTILAAAIRKCIASAVFFSFQFSVFWVFESFKTYVATFYWELPENIRFPLLPKRAFYAIPHSIRKEVYLTKKIVRVRKVQCTLKGEVKVIVGRFEFRGTSDRVDLILFYITGAVGCIYKMTDI